MACKTLQSDYQLFSDRYHRVSNRWGKGSDRHVRRLHHGINASFVSAWSTYVVARPNYCITDLCKSFW